MLYVLKSTNTGMVFEIFPFSKLNLQIIYVHVVRFSLIDFSSPHSMSVPNKDLDCHQILFVAFICELWEGPLKCLLLYVNCHYLTAHCPLSMLFI
jgi:hypothetical protein